ncbi:MAG: class I SAM-dependent methyltransferase [Mycolicibacterium sp.]|uniref:class I SAM-dependent methyltransferase n=1 Tax=Mycolicibacterium sp. TaxID=2320850 RepID=UPI003D0F8A42
MSITMPTFTPAQESLFLTLGSRALDSRLPDPFLGDTMADQILRETGYDLAKFPTLTTQRFDARTKVFAVALRAKRLDEIASRFVGRHPDAVVMDLGVGLDSRILRVNPPSTVSWCDVDFPQIVDLRHQLLPAQVSAHSIGADLTDPNWLDEIPADRPAVIVADGLIAFLRQDDFVSLLHRLTNHFPSGEIAFNLYTTGAIWTAKHLRSLAAISAGLVNPGFNDPSRPERWVAGLKLAGEIFLTRAPEVAELPLATRLILRLAASSARASRMIGTTLVHYEF